MVSRPFLIDEYPAVKISIIVPAFNEEKLIAASLHHINLAGTAFLDRGWETELIVCDNNSTDRTAELARAAGAKVVFEPVNQIARSRNRGAEVAQGDWLVFVDADSHPSYELFADVADLIRRGDSLAGGSTVRMDESSFLGDLLIQGWNLISRVKRWAAGSFVFCDTAVFREIGGFSEELFASEEIDLSKRLKRVAKTRDKRFVILHGHPLLTSARKLHLYSPVEYLRFFGRLLLRPRQTLRQRESCPAWYDGRR
jgi:glycosyltransferase involved in cell wall biosynthesis